MSEVVTCTLEELGDVLLDDADRHVEEVRANLTRGLSYIQGELVAQAPRASGDFAASVRPYVGEPGATWSRGGGGSEAGAAEVAEVMEQWQPGQEVGAATDAPYSRKLIFHAGTYTKKAAHGWVDTIVRQANALMEEG